MGLEPHFEICVNFMQNVGKNEEILVWKQPFDLSVLHSATSPTSSDGLFSK